MTLDVSQTGLNGKETQELLDSVMITTNKEAIPNETLSPFKTSGVRLGTPAITTRGFDEADAKKVAELILAAIDNHDDETALATVRKGVRALTDQHPIDENVAPIAFE